MHIRFLFALLSFLFFQSTPPAGDPPADEPPKDDPPTKPEFTAEQQKVINDWIAKERKKAEEDAAARLKAEADEAKRKADAEAERKRQEAAGEFDKVKDSLTTERDTAVTERDNLKTERDALLALVKADVDAQWDALPDEVKEAYDGDADDPLARKQHMTRMAKVIARLTEKPRTPGNGPNPPASDGKVDLEKIESLQSKRSILS